MREGWEIKKLGEVCDLYQPKTISSDMLVPNGKYLVYGANGIIGRYNEYNHEKPEVLMTCRGATCGTINVSQPYSWINGNAMVIHPKENNIIQPFLKYLLQGIDLSIVITGAAQPQITRQSLKPVKVVLPPVQEQEKIVAELDCLSGIIEKKKRQLKELDNLAQSIFYDMFGDPIANEKGWKLQSFGEVYRLKSGDGLKEKDFAGGDFPVYGGNGISGYHNLFNKSGKHIIIGRVGAYCGNVRFVQGDFWLTDNAFDAFFDDTITDYLYACFLLNTLNLHQYANHAAQPVISNAGLKEVPIILPPIDIQNAFAQKIEAIEKQKELIKKSIQEIETLFNSRMDYWFN